MARRGIVSLAHIKEKPKPIQKSAPRSAPAAVPFSYRRPAAHSSPTEKQLTHGAFRRAGYATPAVR